MTSLEDGLAVTEIDYQPASSTSETITPAFIAAISDLRLGLRGVDDTFIKPTQPLVQYRLHSFKITS